MQKNFRPIACFCLLLVLCMLSFGCGLQDSSKPAIQPQQKELVFAGDIYPPFTYMDIHGNMAGIDIELMQEACRRLGYKSTYKVIPWNNKDKMLGSGEVDAVWSCFSMNGRDDRYAWAGPYLDTRHVVIVGKHTNIKSLADLNGRRVIVQYSSQPEKLLLERKTPDVPRVRDLYSTKNVDALFSALRMGYVDASACNELVAQQYQRIFSGDFVILEQPLMISHLGVAFSKDKQELRASFDAVIKEMRKDGTVERILERYKNGQNEVGGVNEGANKRKQVSFITR